VGLALPSDEELVADTREGDPGAYDQLVKRWERKIHGAAFRVLGSHEDAREVSQEAFLKAYRAIGGFEQRSRLLDQYRHALSVWQWIPIESPLARGLSGDTDRHEH